MVVVGGRNSWEIERSHDEGVRERLDALGPHLRVQLPDHGAGVRIDQRELAVALAQELRSVVGGDEVVGATRERQAHPETGSMSQPASWVRPPVSGRYSDHELATRASPSGWAITKRSPARAVIGYWPTTGWPTNAPPGRQIEQDDVRLRAGEIDGDEGTDVLASADRADADRPVLSHTRGVEARRRG